MYNIFVKVILPYIIVALLVLLWIFLMRLKKRDILARTHALILKAQKIVGKLSDELAKGNKVKALGGLNALQDIYRQLDNACEIFVESENYELEPFVLKVRKMREIVWAGLSARSDIDSHKWDSFFRFLHEELDTSLAMLTGYIIVRRGEVNLEETTDEASRRSPIVSAKRERAERILNEIDKI